eukprot:9477980-Pyramimonas_sp.AAC.1
MKTSEYECVWVSEENRMSNTVSEESTPLKRYSRSQVSPNRVSKPTAVSEVDRVPVQCGLAWNVRT